MLKYLIALADELDRYGEFSVANMVDELIVYAMNGESSKYVTAETGGVEGVPFHETAETMTKYHNWLKEPANWKNPELVSYRTDRWGNKVTGLVHGMSWRNCNLCDATLVVTPSAGEELLIDS